MDSDQKIKPTSKHLKNLLVNFEENLKKINSIPIQDILSFWSEMVGHHVSAMTKAVDFQNGVLFVKVNNSSLYSLLMLHEKQKLLQLLRKKFPAILIKAIHFKLG